MEGLREILEHFGIFHCELSDGDVLTVLAKEFEEAHVKGEELCRAMKLDSKGMTVEQDEGFPSSAATAAEDMEFFRKAAYYWKEKAILRNQDSKEADAKMHIENSLLKAKMSAIAYIMDLDENGGLE